MPISVIAYYLPWPSVQRMRSVGTFISSKLFGATTATTTTEAPPSTSSTSSATSTTIPAPPAENTVATSSSQSPLPNTSSPASTAPSPTPAPAPSVSEPLIKTFVEAAGRGDIPTLERLLQTGGVDVDGEWDYSSAIWLAAYESQNATVIWLTGNRYARASLTRINAMKWCVLPYTIHHAFNAIQAHHQLVAGLMAPWIKYHARDPDADKWHYRRPPKDKHKRVPPPNMISPSKCAEVTDVIAAQHLMDQRLSMVTCLMSRGACVDLKKPDPSGRYIIAMTKSYQPVLTHTDHSSSPLRDALIHGWLLARDHMWTLLTARLITDYLMNAPEGSQP